MCVLHDLHQLIQTDGLLTESIVYLLDEGYGTDNVRALLIRQPLERWGFTYLVLAVAQFWKARP